MGGYLMDGQLQAIADVLQVPGEVIGCDHHSAYMLLMIPCKVQFALWLLV
jgi:hypothetical protein